MKTKILFFALLISSLSFGQVVIASDGFNNTLTDFTSIGANFFTGNSAAVDSPSNSPFAFEGTHSLACSSATVILQSFTNLSTCGYSGVSMSLRLASFSINSTGNGADGQDNINIEISPDSGVTWYSTVRVLGNANARWTYSTGTGIATTPYDGNATSVDFAPSGGGNRTTDGFSTILITGLPSITTLRFRITLTNNDANERWLVDDFKVEGTLATITAVPTVTSSAATATSAYGNPIANYQVTASNCPTSYAATGLPAGVTINTTTGLISGTPTVVGTFTASITATNGIGTSAIVTKDFIITPKPLTITGLAFATKVYDGNTTAILTGTAALSGGLIGTDVVTLSGTYVANFPQANVGTGLTITVSGFTLTGANASKYTLTQPTFTNRSITPKPLTISGLTANNKIYNTTTAATLSGTPVLVGVITPDVVTIAGTPVATFSTATVGTGITVNVTGYSITGAQAANYSVTQPTGLTANITQAPQTITFGPLPNQMLSGTTFTLSATSTSGNPITYTSSNPLVATVTSGGIVTIVGLGTTTFTASQAASTNFSAATPVLQNQTIIVGVPEINIEGNVGTFPSIPNGSTTPFGFNNTLFAAQTIGNSQPKPFRVKNEGGNTLTVNSITLAGANPGDFSISAVPSTPFNVAPPSGIVIFSITFAPTATGIRTAIVTINNNDGDENPYTYVIQGTGNCPTSTISTTPSSGPVGTEVTVVSGNATTNNLLGATATFNGIAATVLSSSASQMAVVIPAGATTGNLVTTNVLGCTATLAYTIIKEDKTTCAGTGFFTDLIMSEVYDSDAFNVWHMELYNPTTSPINLATSNYRILRYANIIDTTIDRNVALTGIVAPQSTFIMNLGDSGAPCPRTWDLVSAGGGINASDRIELTKNGTLVDVVNCPGNTGYTIKRNLTAVGPVATYAAADWTTSNTEDCTDIGLFPFVPRVAPTVDTQPFATVNCTTSNIIISVSGSEGTTDAIGLTYQWYFVAPNVATWSVVNNAGVYTGATTATLNISSIIGLENYQYYCQVRENTSTCFTASNAVKISGDFTTTWNGVAWTNGFPTITKQAIIDADYATLTNLPGSFDCCKLIVNSAKTLTIGANTYVSVENEVINNGGSADNLVINNSGSLVQVNNPLININAGSIKMFRTANIRTQDYVYWSSPVENFNISNVYLASTPTSLIYKWDPQFVNPNLGQGYWLAAAGETMLQGKGYIVRGPSGLGSTVTPITATFNTGKPHNGIVPVAISRGNFTTLPGGNNYIPPPGITYSVNDDNWNLVGNPYPSAISALSFLQYNAVTFPEIEGSVRIWTHGTLPSTAIDNPFYESFQYNYTANDYIVYNGTATISGPTGFNGFIAAGQAFFVLMNDGLTGSSSVTFNNGMRVKAINTNTQFYRSSNATTSNVDADKSRIWLDLINPVGSVDRIVVGYVPNATIEKDVMYDAFTKLDGSSKIFSLIGDEKMCIQGRPLPFDENDQVPLGVTFPNATSYTIAISTVDGLFEGNQDIYLEDKNLNSIHNLKQSPYNFTTTQGEFNDRFVLRFNTNTLGNDGFNIDNSVIVASKDHNLLIKSSTETIKSVQVFDVVGRVILNKNSIGSNEITFNNVGSNQAIIVKIVLENGAIVTRKVLL